MEFREETTGVKTFDDHEATASIVATGWDGDVRLHAVYEAEAKAVGQTLSEWVSSVASSKAGTARYDRTPAA